jgi:hypothetical protein
MTKPMMERLLVIMEIFEVKMMAKSNAYQKTMDA